VSEGKMGKYFWLLLLATATALSAQESGTLSADDTQVKAGQILSYTVTLDRPVDAPDWSMTTIFATSEGQDYGMNGNCSGTPSSTVPAVYPCSLRIPSSASTGVWTLKGIRVYIGTKSADLHVKPFSFRVLANQNLVFPTSAELTVNLSQEQLLRREANRLDQRIRTLDLAISAYGQASAKGKLADFLRGRLKEEIQALGTTEAEFLKLATANSQAPAVQAFFGDLRTNYEAALTLTEKRSSARRAANRPLPVAEKENHGTKDEPQLLLALAVLRPFERNELAYKTIVDGGSLTFDLETDSNPPGATVSYYRRGDTPRQNPSLTNSTIHSLPYAIWHIRFEKQGYNVEDREYDPFREPNRVIAVELQH
jgi:hypothetical protein